MLEKCKIYLITVLGESGDRAFDEKSCLGGLDLANFKHCWR